MGRATEANSMSETAANPRATVQLCNCRMEGRCYVNLSFQHGGLSLSSQWTP